MSDPATEAFETFKAILDTIVGLRSDELPLEEVQAALKGAGLRLVDSRAAAVLDACKGLDLRTRPDGLTTCYGGHREVELAELALREGNR